MDLSTFSQRIRRVDFLDGLGIYVAAEHVSLAHVRKRLLHVTLLESRTYPLAPITQPEERGRGLTEAVKAFVRETRVEPGAVHLCLARQELLLNRLVLPAAARENLAQVLEYEIERVIPLPRDEIFYDYQMRESGQGETGRLAVLVVSVPRRVVRQYIEALEQAGIRPKSVVMAAAALGDYTAFCRGALAQPVALMIRDGSDSELAVFVDDQLVASHGLRGAVLPSTTELNAMVRRDLAEVFHVVDAPVDLLVGTSPNGTGTPAAPDGTLDLFALASGRLEAPATFFEHPEPALLSAVGAALGAVRESVVDINLLPAEHRPGLQEGLFVPLLLMVLLVVLALVYGGSIIVRDEMTRRDLARQVEEMEPQVAAIKQQEADVRKFQTQIGTLTENQDRRMVQFLKELTDKIPPDAYLTTLRYRNGRIEMDGFATKSSELIQILENSPMFRNAQFTSPITQGQGGQERFSIVAEVEG
jgi:general secretion pathway protein L